MALEAADPGVSLNITNKLRDLPQVLTFLTEP